MNEPLTNGWPLSKTSSEWGDICLEDRNGNFFNL